MLIEELKAQALRRLKTGKRLSPEQEAAFDEAMEQALAPFRERDRKAAAAEKPILPYQFDARSVLWLEREARVRSVGIGRESQ